MGYCLTTYAVPLAKLTAIPGSNNQDALAAVLTDAAEYLAELDDQQREAAGEGDDAPVFGVAEAVKDIFAGHWRRPAEFAQYGWAVEVLCCFLGRRLPEGELSGPIHAPWFDAMDDWLVSKQVPLRFIDLVYSEPILLPPVNDWPSIGHWTPERIRAAAPAVDRLLRSGEDGGFVDAMRQVQKWFAVAMAEPGLGIVAFYA